VVIFLITTPSTSTKAAKSAAAVEDAKTILASLEVFLANEKKALSVAETNLKVKNAILDDAQKALALAKAANQSCWPKLTRLLLQLPKPPLPQPKPNKVKPKSLSMIKQQLSPLPKSP
jgi:hypothetical protein